MEKSYLSHGTSSEEKDKHAEISKICNKCIVEIGVLDGDTTAIFLQNNSKVKVYGIAPIIPDSMNANLIGNIERINKLTSLYSNFIFIKDFSYNAVKNWTEEISYLFIDGDHNYEAVKQDFEEWFPFIEIGGIVALHDSAANRGGPYWWGGSSKLSDELLSDNRVEYVDTIYTMTIFKKI